MSIYMTEEEQLDAIKKGFMKYWPLITGVLSVGLLVIAGYRYWHWHVEKVNHQASQSYERLMDAFSKKDNKAMRAYAKQLSTEYPQTVYGDGARLAMARYFVLHQQWDHAREELEYVVGHSKMSPLKAVAGIRIARIMFFQKAYDHALEQLNKINSLAYDPLVNELKGDIFVAMGRQSEARALYQEALVEAKKRGMEHSLLDLKVNDN
jgi:predicted negative regulator of RcsB-dependent stress response